MPALVCFVISHKLAIHNLRRYRARQPEHLYGYTRPAGLAVSRRSSPLNRDGAVPSQSHRLDNRSHQGPSTASRPEQPQTVGWFRCLPPFLRLYRRSDRGPVLPQAVALDPCLIYDTMFRQTKEWWQAAEPAYPRPRPANHRTGHFSNRQVTSITRPATGRAQPEPTPDKRQKETGPGDRGLPGHISLYKHTFSSLPIFTCLHICWDYYSSLRYMLWPVLW